MKEIGRRIVTAYVISSDGKLLLGKKDSDKGGVYIDSWHNIGGGVDEGESDEQALAREVLEETGVDITGAVVKLVDNQGTGESVKTLASGEQVLAKMQFNVFKVILTKPSSEIVLQTSDDLVLLQWFPLAELHTIKLTPPAYDLLDRIGTDWLYKP